MSVIIRLQNLLWNAHALDIRQFFKGLSIPDGGVHILGGDLGDAFIAFSTDEDARRGMMLNGEKLNGVPVKLFLSSKTEMQKVIALARGAPMDKDERPNVALPQMNVPPPFVGSGSIAVSSSTPFNQPPPPIPIQQQNLPPGQMAATLLGNVNFNQAPSSTLPFPGGLTPQGHKEMMPNVPGRGQTLSGPRYSEPPPMIGQQYSNKVDVPPRLPQRPDILRNDRPDVLKREGQRPERASIVRYDKIGVDLVQKETPDIIRKPDIVRDERRRSRERGRSGSYERRETKRTDRHDDHSRDRHDERAKDERRDGRRGESRGEDDRKEKQDGYRSRDRHDEGRRYDDRDKRYERSERRRDNSRERDSRKRDRQNDKSSEPKYEDDRYRDRHDSKDREKRARYGREVDRKGDYFKDERSKQFTKSRARYGTGSSEEIFGDQHDPGTCAFLSQMPLSISYKDVRRLFSREQLRLPENGLKLENDEFGNRNGNAYVMFASKEFREKAVDLDGTFLEGNRVRVERCSLLDFEQAIDSFVPQDNRRKGIEKVEKQFHGQVENQPDIIPHSPRSSERSRKEFFETCCVMLRNLPLRVERYEVRLFFKSLSITQNGVYIPFDDKGACLGVSYVEFETVQEAEEALRRYDGAEFMTSKHRVDMYPITMEEAKERIEQHKRDFMKGGQTRKGYDRRHDRADGRRDRIRDDFRRDEFYRGRDDHNRDRSERQLYSREKEHKWDNKINGNERKLHEIPPKSDVTDEMIAKQKYQCVRLNGLPFHADVGLVEGFFFDLSIRPNGIHVVFFPDARCIGVAYVEFTNMDDCSKALQRDNTAVGKRAIRVSPITEEDMVAELNGHKVNDQYVVSRATQDAPGQPCDVIMSNVPFKANMFDVNQFLHGTGFIPESILFEVDQQGNAMGNVKVTFFNSQAAHRALLTLLKKQFQGRIVRFKVLQPV